MKRVKLITIALLLIPVCRLFAQNDISSDRNIIYTNPASGSIYNNPETTITIGFEQQLTAILLDEYDIQLKNSDGQIVEGILIHPTDQSKLIFEPKLKLASQQSYLAEVLFGEQLMCRFNFFTDGPRKKLRSDHGFETIHHSPVVDINEKDLRKAENFRKRFNLPESFPAIEVINSNHPGGGYYLLNRINQVPGVTFYLIILDTLGFPVYYKKIDANRVVNNFSLQETGYLSFWDNTDGLYYIMDSSYQIIHSYGAQNGYPTDGHELILKNDGSYWVMIYDDRIVDMSEIVPDGQENAVVTGLVIQHIDEEGNVLFEWKSWDHFQITDADPELVPLSALGIDYVHGNAMDFDCDDNLLVSARNLSEITKINITNGEVMWRWGGTQNQFEFIGDSLMFSAQHNIRYLGNNIYSLFDNGNGRDVYFSRGLYYELNTDEMTASLHTNYNKYDSLVFAPFMGSFFTSEYNERVMGWSYNVKRYVISEYDSLGNILLEVRSLDTAGLMSYRVEKRFWETNAISFDRDEILIDAAQVNDTILIEFELTNNLNNIFNLNGFNSSDSSFKLLEELPIGILPGETKALNLVFVPTEEKSYHAAISLFTDDQIRRIAKQFRVKTNIITAEEEFADINTDVNVFPNPSSTAVQLSTEGGIEINKISVYNLNGQKLFANTYGHTQVSLNVRSLQSGIYLLKIETNSGEVTKRIVVE